MSDVSRAEIGSRNSDVEIDRNIALRVIKSRFLNLLAEHCCYFPCDTVDGLAVRSVCSDGNVENIIIKAKDGLNVCTGNRIFRKDQKSVVTCAGEHVLSNADLNTGAEHSV